MIDLQKAETDDYRVARPLICDTAVVFEIILEAGDIEVYMMVCKKKSRKGMELKTIQIHI